MRIISWNLGHQTREAPISGLLEDALAELRPDVLVLNEFVDGPSRRQLRKSLGALGLMHVHVSSREGRHNQVLTATAIESVPGELQGPQMPGGAGRSNFLHLQLADGSEVVGFRAPTYRGEDLVNYWTQLSALIRSMSSRRIIWIGDVNADPDNPRSVGGKYLRGLERDGWTLPRPEGQWSFIGGSRIDHVLASQGLVCSRAEYITTLKGKSLAGPKSAAHVSDHAALLAVVEPR